MVNRQRLWKDLSPFGKGLWGVLEKRGQSVRWLARQLEEIDVTGKSRPMLHRYMKEGGPEPPDELVEAIANVLEVPPSLLREGRVRGPKSQRVRFPALADSAFIRELEPDPKRAAALRRFALKLADLEEAGSEARGDEEQDDLLRGAATFLRGADTAYAEALEYIAEPPTISDYDLWADDLLAAFLRRIVYGTWVPNREED